MSGRLDKILTRIVSIAGYPPVKCGGQYQIGCLLHYERIGKVYQSHQKSSPGRECVGWAWHVESGLKPCHFPTELRPEGEAISDSHKCEPRNLCGYPLTVYLPPLGSDFQSIINTVHLVSFFSVITISAFLLAKDHTAVMLEATSFGFVFPTFSIPFHLF